MDTDRSYTKLKKLKASGSEVEFQAEIPVGVLERNTAKALVEVSSTFELPGFRKGKAPEDVVRKHVDKTHLFEDAANESLKDAIREIVKDSAISIVGSPVISLEKIALGSPIIFRVKLALFPEVKLPDYRSIAKNIYERKDDVEVTDNDLRLAIERIQRSFLPGEERKSPAALPELTDEFVKKLGPFKSISEFKDELRKQLQDEKLAKVEEVKKDEVVREIVKNSKLSIPTILIDQELERFRVQRDANLKEADLSFDKYLKESGKTAESLAKEEAAFIEEQLKSQFVINRIQSTEGIVATDQEIAMNAEFLKFRHPDRSESYLHNMAETMILNRKTFDLLEGKSLADKATEVAGEH